MNIRTENAMAVTSSFLDSRLLRGSSWQMLHGERAALVGLLRELRPSISIEIGTAQGGSLEVIAEYSEVVHTFDIEQPAPDLQSRFPNVRFHVGDSRATVPKVLDEIAAAGQHVDFALVDGDHTEDGVRADTTALLESAACANTVVLFHDTSIAEVRSALDGMRLARHPKVAFVELDFVPGVVLNGTLSGDFRRFRTVNGVGLMVLGTGASTGRMRNDGALIGPAIDDDVYPPARLNRLVSEALSASNWRSAELPPRLIVATSATGETAETRLALVERELDVAREKAAESQAHVRLLESSTSWRITKPLRSLGRLAKSARRRGRTR